MRFAYPLCLFGLIPWVALALYALAGRRRRVAVPFLDLWPRGKFVPVRRRSWSVSPFVAAVLAGIFITILAAAAPRRNGLGTDRSVVIILDRGLTMSARDGSARRYQSLLSESSPEIAGILGAGSARLITVPGVGAEIVDRGTWPVDAAPTAVDTRPALRDAVKNSLLDPRAIVILLSDQDSSVADPRLVQIVPSKPIENIGIAELSVRQRPAAQAMVRVINDSHLASAQLTVTSAAPVSIQLPDAGTAQNYFIDLKEPPAVIEASIEPGGDLDADDHAWAVRQAANPALAVECELPQELARVVEVYRKDRPVNAESASVLLVDHDLPAEQRGIEIASSFEARAEGDVHWESGPLTQGIDWTAAVRDARVSQSQQGAGWKRLVWAQDRTLVAQRAGQLWIGFHSPQWAATTDFVLFWARAFDWLGEGPGGYGYKTAGDMDVPLWPGLYGKMAVNATAVHMPMMAAIPWQSRLATLAATRVIGGAALGAWIAVVALGCLLIAAVAMG